MAREEKVVEFPSPDEGQRRVLVEAQRLANLAPGEWRLWIAGSAERLGIPLANLTAAVSDIIKDREQKAREEKAEARRQEERAEKKRIAAQRKEEQERKRAQLRINKEAERKHKEKRAAFASLIRLPSVQHETKLAELAKRLDEDVARLREEFSEFGDVERSSAPTSEWHVAPWPEPVATEIVLQELRNKINKHVRLMPHEALTVALWILMAWVHNEIAHNSPYLVATSAEDSAGKTTLIVEVVGRLAPRAYSVGEPTAAIFRFIDHEKPTLIVDDADTLFQRKRDLAHIFNVAWTRGAKIPRQERIGGHLVTVWFDPFCPKAATLIGTNLPRALYGRCIVIKMWPLKAGEHVEEVTGDDEEFETLRRKLARWAADNAGALAQAKPLYPAGLTNKKSRPNWKLLLAIAELAGGTWPKQAREAAERLSRSNRKPSRGLQLLAAMRDLSASGRTEILSADVVAHLTSDPDSEWSEYRGKGPITQRQVAELLDPYDIHPVNIHPTKRKDKCRRGYRLTQFAEVFARFLPHDPLIRSPRKKRT